MTPDRVIGICPRCGGAIEDLSRPCPSCGAVISSQSQMPTMAAPEPGASDPLHSGPIGRLDPSPSTHGVAFTAGQVLAGRYRIIGLLGRGGMGEVFRADDLELGQAVSIKFLPRSLEQAPGALERFRGEVRNARQISHPNVCRVYDIGEYQGLHFLTMEFVDGEDLATLLRRIGKLPTAKANEVASQLCAGIAAAHDKGVLHRDLKPSNVMIDGEGHVRITDFGLAVRVGEGAGDFAGTPAYMAPEQFAGQPLTVRSDLYSLGLILYEIYTGRRPFEATSVAEWKSRHTQSQPTLPSERDEALDETVERAILRCLEKDPMKRPASARQLAAALPGGDPLAAALAAGETPSPEMVAAAGGEGALAPRTAWALAAGIVAAMVAVLLLGPFSGDLGLAPMTMSREVLRDRASQILDRFGYGRDVVDRESWFQRVYDPMIYLARHAPSTQWRAGWRALGAPILMTYRQSPRWMMPQDLSGRLNGAEPPYEISDMATVGVSAEGRLRYLRAVPLQLDSARTPAPTAFAWSALFDAAAIDTASFRPAAPVWVPPGPYDARAEWSGTARQLPGVPLRIAAAAYGGRPVYFEIFGPWSRPDRMVRPTVGLTQRIAIGTVGFFTAVSLVGAIFLTRRNRRLGRGDVKGASRLAGVLFLLGILSWLVGGHHVPTLPEEFVSFTIAASGSLLIAALSVLMYVAVEPYVRRRMPELMIGWARLLEGRVRDPRVGRDVLLGALAGCASALLVHLSNAVPAWIPILGQTTVPPDARMLESVPHALASVIDATTGSLVRGLSLFFILFLLRTLIRRERMALIAMLLLLSLAGLGGENVALETPFAVIRGVLMGWVVGRVGLLALTVMWFYAIVVSAIPIPVTASAPYAPVTVMVVVLMIALVGYALRISIGSRPLLSGAALDD